MLDPCRLRREMPSSTCWVKLWTMQVFIKRQILLRQRLNPVVIHVGQLNINALWCTPWQYEPYAKHLHVPQEGNSMSKHHISVTINGTVYEDDVDSRMLLVHWIRDGLQLTGTSRPLRVWNRMASSIHCRRASTRSMRCSVGIARQG